MQVTEIGSENPGMTSLAPIFALLDYAGKIHKKIEFQPNEEIFANLAQCDIKIYSGSKKC